VKKKVDGAMYHRQTVVAGYRDKLLKGNKIYESDWTE
jgi:hypothetical protein